MARKLQDWLEKDVRPFQKKSASWISQYHFFRDPIRPSYSDLGYFFSPADGIILYQRKVRPGECIVEIKGRAYSLQEAMRDPHYDSESFVIGVFMTFFDVHTNRIPYPGTISFVPVDPIDTYNHPMLAVEKSILRELRVSPESLDYLHHNQRVVNRVYSSHLGQAYYMLQVADYDVDCIVPFKLKQNQPVFQGQRFSQVRYGSQVDLVVPLSSRFEFEPVQEIGDHVEAGTDALIRITERSSCEVSST